MRIDFFEEYPASDALERAPLVTWPSTIYLAAEDLDGFHDAAARLRAAQPALAPAWWPILPRSYWISPFARADELVALRRALEASGPLTVLLDLELPLLAPARFLTGLPGFLAGRRAVRDLARAAAPRGHRLVTAEYPTSGPLALGLLRALGVSLPLQVPHTKLPMLYSSMIPGARIRAGLRAALARLARHHPGRFGVGLGTIAKGALGNEPILPVEALARDLAHARASGLEAATIFRLGGLDERYAAVCARFADGGA